MTLLRITTIVTIAALYIGALAQDTARGEAEASRTHGRAGTERGHKGTRNHLKIYVLTDLEGPAGVAVFEQTREEGAPKREAMELLTAEVNACIEGILDADADAEILVIDGHGSGGLIHRDLQPKAKLFYGKSLTPPAAMDASFDALFFVGQHAMSGTPDAPLAHTYSSKTIEYYKLNGRPVGETACRTAMSGVFGVPLAFLSGDDKACREAEALTSGVTTVQTKQGLGIETAIHLSPRESCARIRAGARAACWRIPQLGAYRIDPPYELEIRVKQGASIDGYLKRGATRIDDRTCVFRTDDIMKLPI